MEMERQGRVWGGGKGGDGGIGVGGMSRTPSPTEIVRNEEGEVAWQKMETRERRLRGAGEWMCGRIGW